MRKLFAQHPDEPSYELHEFHRGHNQSFVVKEFVSELLRRDPKNRCTAKEALALPYLDSPKSVTKNENALMK